MIAEINNKLANIYTKEEANNKYLSKENVVNEENYTRKDIKTGGLLKNSGFWLNELSSSEDLRFGFVFNYYDISTPTNPVPVITHKYLFDCENGNCDVYLSEDRTMRIIFQDKTGSTGPSGQPMYFFYLYNIQTSLDTTQFSLNEWYLESGYKFDSYNVYCKEMVDELVSQSS